MADEMEMRVECGFGILLLWVSYLLILYGMHTFLSSFYLLLSQSLLPCKRLVMPCVTGYMYLDGILNNIGPRLD